MARVSIIIPSFNSASFIKETLLNAARSITADDEIIVVDDHSSDSSPSIAEDVIDSLSIRAKIEINPGKGACSARNHGFHVSSGEWVQWLDADDLVDPKKTVQAIGYLKDNPTHLIACPWHPFHDNLEHGQLPDDVDWDTIPVHSTPADWLARDTFMGLHCYAGHRSLFEKAGPWDESLTINQDGEYFARVIAQSEGVHFTRETEVYYRRASSGSVSRFTPEKADSLFRSTESMAATAMKVESSKRMQQMVSNRWQHFIYTVYPSRADLIEQAETKLQGLPKPTISNPNAVSPLSRWVSDTFGWKALTQARLLIAKLSKA